MSWQATAWAEKRKTGSPARKVLLLVLANYANEQGYCWPSQETLCGGTEQSVDTVQRQLKRLAADGHLTIERKPRSSGRWPSLAYRLHMFTEPQNAVRSAAHSAVDKPDSLRPGHTATSTDHQAATDPATEPQALRHEPSKNIQREPSLEPPPPSSAKNSVPREVKRTAKQECLSIQAVQNQVVRRLGKGDVAEGWVLFGALDGLDRKYLEDAERRGEPLNPELLDEYRRTAERRMAGDFDGAAA